MEEIARVKFAPIIHVLLVKNMFAMNVMQVIRRKNGIRNAIVQLMLAVRFAVAKKQKLNGAQRAAKTNVMTVSKNVFVAMYLFVMNRTKFRMDIYVRMK